MGARLRVALIRGINVGGRNRVPMADLRAAAEAAGCEAVSTYIQSGNLLFESTRTPRQLEVELEAELERRFGTSLVVVVRSHAELRRVVERAPGGFGEQPERFHSDVVFLRHPLTAAQAMEVVELREGVDQAWAGERVVYFARLSERRTQSRMSAIVGTPPYRRMTVRSWSTTTTLLALLDGRAA